MVEADVTGYIANGEWDLVGEFLPGEAAVMYSIELVKSRTFFWKVFLRCFQTYECKEYQCLSV